MELLPSVNKKVVCIIGTRPEVIKMAPVIRALGAVPGLTVSVLNSGQHRDLLAQLIDWFELRIDHDLRAMTENQSLTELTARLVRGFEEQFVASLPDLVLAQGDTTTVMCSALTCFYLNIPFGHVEAGLRTFNARNPFPEEFNRVAVARLAQLHFCPTARAHANVIAEHADTAAAHITGNTVIDALHFTTAKLKTRTPRNFDHDILVTAHRRENFGAPFTDICGALLDLCNEFPQLKILYPVHPNPNVRLEAARMLAGEPRITLAGPLDYPDLVAAMQRAKLILTDSGGIQEEAPALGKPVLVLREVSERPEAVELGVAKLVGTARATIVAETRRLLLSADHYTQMARGVSPYGDGLAANRIRDIVCRYLNGGASR
jgi:UDP-N-acetylglucosamine 2-epimerase (non-hydrolysing)